MLHESPQYFFSMETVQGCKYVQSAIAKMYDNNSDMIMHREYFTTVGLSRRCAYLCSLSENYKCLNHLILKTVL